MQEGKKDVLRKKTVDVPTKTTVAVHRVFLDQLDKKKLDINENYEDIIKRLIGDKLK